MKNTIKNTKKGILMLALMATVTGFANDTDNLIKIGAKKTSLVIENVKAGNQLTIKDFYGSILYKESIEINGLYKKGFDLTELPDGDYVFELEKDLEIKTIPFTVSLSEVRFNKADEASYFKPYINQKEDLIYLTKLNSNLKTTTINIYAINSDGDSKLRHSEEIEKTQVIEKIFKLEKGNYKIIINSDNKEYVTFINN